jgi:hypothetical protein
VGNIEISRSREVALGSCTAVLQLPRFEVERRVIACDWNFFERGVS